MGKDLDINIRENRTGTNQVREAAKDVRNLAGEAQRANRGGFFRRMRDDLRSIGREIPVLGRLGRTLQTIVSGPLGAIMGGFLAAGVAIRGATAAVAAFAEKEKSFDRLDAALVSSGQLTGEYRQELRQLADELQRTTGIADTEWLATLQRLIQFGARPETIGMDAANVRNLAGLVGDLQTATSLYARALQGDFGTLGRYGILIDANASQLEKMDELQRQAARGAGILEASTLGLSGRLQGLKNDFGDSTAVVGRAIVQYLEMRGVIQPLEAALGGMARAAEGSAQGASKLSEEQSRTNRVIREAGEAAEEARRKYGDLSALGLSMVEKATREADAATTDALNSQRQTIALLDEQTRATQRLEQARINLQEAQGEISPEEARARRAALGGRTDAEIRERRTQGISDEIATRQGAITERTGPVVEEFHARRALGEQTAGARASLEAARASGADAGTLAELSSAVDQLRAKEAALDDVREERIRRVNAANEADRARIAVLERELELRRQINATEAQADSLSQAAETVPFAQQAQTEQQRALVQSAGLRISQNIAGRRGGGAAFATGEQLDAQRANAQQAAQRLARVTAQATAGGGDEGLAELLAVIAQVTQSLENDVASRRELTRLATEVQRLKSSIQALR